MLAYLCTFLGGGSDCALCYLWLCLFGQVAEYLLEQGADVNAQDKGGLIPLHNASSYGHLDIAALLIKYNTIVNATGESFTPTVPYGTVLPISVVDLDSLFLRIRIHFCYQPKKYVRYFMKQETFVWYLGII